MKISFLKIVFGVLAALSSSAFANEIKSESLEVDNQIRQVEVGELSVQFIAVSFQFMVIQFPFGEILDENQKPRTVNSWQVEIMDENGEILFKTPYKELPDIQTTLADYQLELLQNDTEYFYRVVAISSPVGMPSLEYRVNSPLQKFRVTRIPD